MKLLLQHRISKNRYFSKDRFRNYRIPLKYIKLQGLSFETGPNSKIAIFSEITKILLSRFYRLYLTYSQKLSTENFEVNEGSEWGFRGSKNFKAFVPRDKMSLDMGFIQGLPSVYAAESVLK